MALLMVRPTWPAPTFVRTLITKRDRKGNALESKRVTFSKDSPVELTDDELRLLGSDLGNAVFEVTLAEKKRVRYLEPRTQEADATAQAE